MRKILIVSYHFPPDASVGGMRPAKFAKYLPEFGWKPIILTVKERHYPVTDQSKLKNLGPVPHVYRTRMLPRPGSLYITLKSRLGKATRGPANTPIVISACSQRGALALLRRALGSLEYLPDDKQIWLPLAVATAANIIRRHNVGAFLTTGRLGRLDHRPDAGVLAPTLSSSHEEERGHSQWRRSRRLQWRTR